MRPRALHPLLVLLLIAGLTACAPPPEPVEPEPAEPAVDLAAEEQAIRDSSMQCVKGDSPRLQESELTWLAGP